MVPGGGKRKGSAFEREICVTLSKWISNNTSDSVFWRSALSGGRATIARKSNKSHASQVGDISCIDNIGFNFISKFSIECKHYQDLNFLGLLTNKGNLLNFWNEIKKQAEMYNKEPMLFARQNRVQTLVCFSKAGMALLGLRADEATVINPKNDLYIMSADYFVVHTKPFV